MLHQKHYLYDIFYFIFKDPLFEDLFSKRSEFAFIMYFLRLNMTQFKQNLACNVPQVASYIHIVEINYFYLFMYRLYYL